MSIQSIIDSSTQIEFAATKTVGTTVSRNGRVRTGQLASSQPWQFVVDFAPIATYADVRGILQQIDYLDSVHTEAVNIGSTNTGLSWITAYQGDLSAGQILQITATTTYAGASLTLNVASVTGASPSDYVFKKGDFIQLDGGYKYPYQVVDDVLLGSGSTISVTLNRPVIEQTGYTINTGKGILVGTDVTWTVKMMGKPTWTVLPSRYVAFNGSFALMEVIGD